MTHGPARSTSDVNGVPTMMWRMNPATRQGLLLGTKHQAISRPPHDPQTKARLDARSRQADDFGYLQAAEGCTFDPAAMNRRISSRLK